MLFRGEVANNRRNKVLLLLLLLEVVRESSRCAIRHDVGHARGPKKAEETGKEPEQPEERELGAGEANNGPITVLRGERGSEERGSNTVAIAAATAMVFHQRFSVFHFLQVRWMDIMGF